MEYDLKITGGIIYDGTGAPGFTGDVGIKDGCIAALGDAPESAQKTIDATGRVVAPGFVDIHTHYDFQVLWDPMLSISPWHGVTSVVIGNCGFGIAPTRPEHRDLMIGTMESVEGMERAALAAGIGPDWPFETFPEYLDAIEAHGISINVGAMVGHSPLRLYVMGEDATERAATDEEISAMRALVDEAMAAGALGFATSKSAQHIGYEGKPVPSRLAEMDEMLALTGALGDAGRGLMMATGGPGFFFKEFARIAEANGRPVCWSALLAGMKGPGSHRSFLERVHTQQESGLEIVPQVIGRPVMFEFTMEEPFILEGLECFAPVSRADHAGKMKTYADPHFAAAFLAEVGTSGLPPFGSAWEESVVSFHPVDTELEGKRVCDIAAGRGMEPFALMLEIARNTGLKARFRMAVVNTDEDAVGELLNDPATVLGLSDAGAHAGQLCDSCFATDILGRWVRDKNAIPMERAIHMLTRRPAELFGLMDRGLLATGAPADVVVFDPETVGAGPLRRIADLPGGTERLVSDAIGIETVICNGVVIRAGGKDQLGPDDALPGKLLRG